MSNKWCEWIPSSSYPCRRLRRRTYFFDVRATKAGDYYLTITESKKFTNDDGSFHYKKHKIYLYKEDFDGFTEILNEMTNFVIDEKGEEVISERMIHLDKTNVSVKSKSTGNGNGVRNQVIKMSKKKFIRKKDLMHVGQAILMPFIKNL